MRPDSLLRPDPIGLCCPRGEFHIDPVKPVASALITHGHSDHAKAGHGRVMATPETLAIMAARLGDGFAGSVQAIELGETFPMGEVDVTFHPAGHVLGSAQIAVQCDGLRIVASGDYKRKPDPTCRPFEPVPCDVFITEATFALPVFRQPDPAVEIDRLLESVSRFPARTHLVGAYALGKAQRIIALLRGAGYAKSVYIHGALEPLCRLYEDFGIDLGPLAPATLEPADNEPVAQHGFAGEIVLCPPSALTDHWSRRFSDPVLCLASGWMGIRAHARRRGIELPLILSDHCDWEELTQTIVQIGCREVWVTHGREDALVRWCQLNEIAARPLNLVGYEGQAD